MRRNSAEPVYAVADASGVRNSGTAILYLKQKISHAAKRISPSNHPTRAYVELGFNYGKVHLAVISDHVYRRLI